MTLSLSSHALEVLTLGLGDEVFAVEAGHVREILDLVPVTAVPNAKPFARGLINVRGNIVPLADLRVVFGMDTAAGPTPDTRIVVLEVVLDGEPAIVGILADKVYEVTEIAASALEATPRIGMRWRPEFIRGIGKRADGFVILPDLGRVLSTASVAVAA